LSCGFKLKYRLSIYYISISSCQSLTKKTLAMIAIILDEEEENCHQKRRTTWVREMLIKRKQFGNIIIVQ